MAGAAFKFRHEPTGVTRDHNQRKACDHADSMIDAEYLEEAAAEIIGLLREHMATSRSLHFWQNEIAANGITHEELMAEIDRQRAASMAAELALKTEQAKLAL